MNRATEENRKDVVRQHIAEGRTLSSLAAEYGISKRILQLSEEFQASLSSRKSI